MSNTVLITRPLTQAQDFANALGALGLQALIAPVLEIETLNFKTPHKRYDGLIFTSAQAVFPFANHYTQRDTPVFVVGPQTEAAARASGFIQIIKADGTVQDLERMIADNPAHADQTFLYVRGEHVSYPLTETLNNIDDIIVYRAIPANNFSEPVLRAFQAKEIDVVTLFSKRSAVNFINLIKKYMLESHLKDIKLLCLSNSVLQCVQAYSWADTYVSARPDRQSMIDRLRGLYMNKQENDVP